MSVCACTTTDHVHVLLFELQVLMRGGGAYVQHTLKSMLSEDCVRQAYSRPPRTEHTGRLCACLPLSVCVCVFVLCVCLCVCVSVSECVCWCVR